METPLSYACFNMAVTLLLLLFPVRDLLLSTFRFLGRFGLVDCDVFKDSVSERAGALFAINSPTSTSPAPLARTSMPVWLTSGASCFCAICNGSTTASLLSSTAPDSSPLGQPCLTLAPRSGVRGSTEFQYCTSQSALLRLPAYVSQIGQIFRLMVVVHSSPHNPDQQVLATRCAVLSLLRPHWPALSFPSPRRYICARCGGESGRPPPSSLSQRAHPVSLQQ